MTYRINYKFSHNHQGFAYSSIELEGYLLNKQNGLTPLYVKCPLYMKLRRIETILPNSPSPQFQIHGSPEKLTTFYGSLLWRIRWKRRLTPFLNCITACDLELCHKIKTNILYIFFMSLNLHNFISFSCISLWFFAYTIDMDMLYCL